MAAERSAREGRGLTSDQRYRLISQAIDSIAGIIKAAFFCVLLAVLAYWMREVLLAYAGKATLANVVIKLAADLRFDQTFAYIFGAGGIAYGLAQRQLRRRNIDRLTRRGIAAEQILDPNRTSSELTPRGTTRPEDR